MRQAEVKIGGTYIARVSGRLVKVQVVLEDSHRSGRSRRFVAKNLETGREIRCTAARLRHDGPAPKDDPIFGKKGDAFSIDSLPSPGGEK